MEDQKTLLETQSGVNLSIHQRKQWDLDCNPLICVHAGTTRIFCLWNRGIQVGALLIQLIRPTDERYQSF